MNIDKRVSEFVSRETVEKYQLYLMELEKWNRALSLVQKSTLAEFWSRHVLDSLQIIPYIGKESSVIDIGAGAGFPGMVLAIAGVENITLCESNRKKCIFLEEIKRITQTDVEVINCRVEDIKDRKFDLVISRACSSISQLLQYGSFVSRETNSRFLLHKGVSYLEEIQEAQKKWMFEWLKIPSITSKDGVILDIRNVNKILK